MTATPEAFRSAGPEERVRIVEQVLFATLRELRPGEPDWFDADTRLADLEIDSIQLVEIKFALDQLVDSELDVNLFIVNPTLRELVVSITSAADGSAVDQAA